MSTFASQLRFFRQRTVDPLTGQAITQERLAELLEVEMDIPGYNNKKISRWETGQQTIEIAERRLLLGLIAILTKYGGIQTPGEANSWLESGGYRPITFQECCEVARLTGQNRDQICGEYQNVAPRYLDLDALRLELERIVWGEEEDVLTRSSWAGRGLAAFGRLVYGPGGRSIFPGLLLAVSSTILIFPYWQEANITLSDRLIPMVWFTVGATLIPLLIAFAARPDQLPGEEPYRADEFWRLFFLKWTAAAVGYGVFLIMFVLVGIIFAPFGWMRALSLASFLLSSAGVLFGWMAARQAAASRIVMFGRPLQLHRADRLFFVIFLGMGPLLLLMVEAARDFIFTSSVGSLPVVIALLIVFLKVAVRKQA